jgi:predicted alpha/beta superfamily hydrolase
VSALLFGKSAHLPTRYVPFTQEIAMTESDTQPVFIEGARRHLLHADAIDQTFAIDVLSPAPDAERGPFPVVYVTDGNFAFPMVASTAGLLTLGQELPPVILVGIGYPDASDVMKLRSRELTPSTVDDFTMTPGTSPLPSGGADAFLDFISHNLKPMIEENYPAKASDDTLVGDSLGGLFSLYAMLTRGTEYRRYIAGSPSIWWDDRALLNVQVAAAGRTPELASQLFISVGGLEEPAEGPGADAKMVRNMHSFADVLERNFKNLVVTRHEFEGETHVSVIPATMSRGLREVFREEAASWYASAAPLPD